MNTIKQQNSVNKPNGAGIGRIFKATHCSFKGLSAAWQYESAFRQELTLAIILLPFAFILASSNHHLLMLISCLTLILFAEIINSALEALADAITLEHHTLIGRAKDMGSAAVFYSLELNSNCVGTGYLSIFF